MKTQKVKGSSPVGGEVGSATPTEGEGNPPCPDIEGDLKNSAGEDISNNGQAIADRGGLAKTVLIHIV